MSRNVRRAWQIIGPGPWICYFCNGAILQRGRGLYECHAHHVDGDKENDVEGNVVPAHGLCHHQYHHVNGDYPGMTGKKHSVETRRKMSEDRQGSNNRPVGTFQHTEESKLKISKAIKGTKRKPRTPEHMAKIIESRRRNAGLRGKTW